MCFLVTHCKSNDQNDQNYLIENVLNNFCCYQSMPVANLFQLFNNVKPTPHGAFVPLKCQ